MGNINSFVSMSQGEYKEILVQVQNSAGQPINISGITAINWAMALTENDAPILTKSYPGSGILLSDPTNGYYSIILSGIDTTAVSPRTYYQTARYDLNGKTIESLVGTVRIRPTII
jgi:hypothetical protein